MIQIVSFVNKNNTGFINFKNSFNKFEGWELNIIGKNIQWKGWITRMTQYRDYAKNSDPNELLVFLDAFDVVCIKNSNDFKKKFEQMNRKYIFGCEDICNIIATCKRPKKWQKINNIYDFFVNGGCVIARAKDIIYLWDWCIKNKHIDDDQIALGYFMDEHPYDVMLDTKNIFVYNDLFGKSDLSIQNNHILLNKKILNSYFIHFPGLMSFHSISLHLNLGITPTNYIIVVKHILGNDAFTEFPINSQIYKTSWISIIIILIIFLFLLILFIVLYLLCKKNNCKKKIK
jgi:hypothetical protein